MLVQGYNWHKYPSLALSRRVEFETERAQDLGKQSDKTAEPNNELYSLDSRTFKREITPIISLSLPRSSPSQGLRV